MLVKMGGAGGVDVADKPQISFDGKWSGWHIEVYNGEPYWEALFSSSGTLASAANYVADLWGIGGGGAGGRYYSSGSSYGNGAGSGYTNMAEDVVISTGASAITIGAGGSTLSTGTNSNTDRVGSKGGTTAFLSLSCPGGDGGSGTSYTGGMGGSNGGARGSAGGENGTPGADKIMSKFWSKEHNTEYGAGGASDDLGNGGGGGGYTDVGATGSTSGHGYGGGGGGAEVSGSGNMSSQFYDWRGKAGCLIIRIKI